MHPGLQVCKNAAVMLHFFLNFISGGFMARIKYYFDTESSQYRRAHVRASDQFVTGLAITILSIGIALVMMMMYSTYFESPRELKLSHEIKEMEFYYTELGKKVES